MWTSEDGHEWQEVDLADLYHGIGGFLMDITYRDNVFVAVGYDSTEVFNEGNGLVLRWETGNQ